MNTKEHNATNLLVNHVVKYYRPTVELHIYSHGGHGGGINPRKGIPFGTWHVRFIDWAKDQAFMTIAGKNQSR